MLRVLVLGGAGFIGRHASAALAARGHEVVVGTRRPARAAKRLPARLHGCERREVHLERLITPEAWEPLLHGVDTVINAVGIMRERPAERYSRVHHIAPAALAAACARRAIRLVHVSALGLHASARSGFLSSKLAGEHAIAACGSNYSIVRPSLLDGEGGFGAAWFRHVARWPVHFVPADACGRTAALHVRDLGECIAVLSEKRDAREWREVELGGSVLRTLSEYLAALRPTMLRPAVRIAVPGGAARIASHLCDLAHFSPFSFGHLELLRRDNIPNPNRLPALLGREPAPIEPARNARMDTAPRESGPSDMYGWLAVLRNVLPFLLLLAAAPLLHRWSPAAPWILAPMIGLFAYRITIVMHDCIHRNLFGNARLNERIGRILGYLTGIDFARFSRLHLLHHRLYGRPGDPQGFHYLGLKSATRAQFVWHLLRPLLGWNLRYALAESFLRPANLARSVRTGEIFVLAAIQLSILATVTDGAMLPWLALLPFVSAATFGLFFSQLRGVAEHAAGSGDAEAHKVRSHAPHLLDRLFLYDVNFNYHKEHHLYPQYSSRDLAALHAGSTGAAPASMFCTLRSLAADRA